MSPVLILTLAAVLVGAALVVVLLLALAGRRRLEGRLEVSHRDLARLRKQLDDLARRVEPGPSQPAGDPEHPGYLITSLSGEGPGGVPEVPSDPPAPDVQHPSGRAFAAVAAEESLIRVVTVAHGVRRALSAENRNRIRFEVAREVKRARRERRRELEQARRHLRAEQAAGRRPDAEHRRTQDAA
ncbi:MAG: hypothetical protein ABI776_18025 [Nocardioidaceae bacterium]